MGKWRRPESCHARRTSRDPSPLRKPWRPPLIVKASVAWHVGAGVAAVAHADRLAVGARRDRAEPRRAHRRRPLAALDLARPATGLRLPAARRRAREIAMTIDDGPDPGGHARPCSTCSTRTARTRPSSASPSSARGTRRCAARSSRRGHSVQNHSERHSHTFLAARAARPRARDRRPRRTRSPTSPAQRPRFFRAPAGLRNPFLAPVLQRLGLQLVQLDAARLRHRAARPGRACSRAWRAASRAGDILLLHDGHARAHAPTGVPVILAVLPALLAARARGVDLVPVTLPRGACAAARRRRRPSRMSDRRQRAAWRALVDAASAPYRALGPLRLALRARQAAAGDPVFRHVLAARPDRAARARARHRLRPGPARQPAARRGVMRRATAAGRAAGRRRRRCARHRHRADAARRRARANARSATRADLRLRRHAARPPSAASTRS